MVVRQVTLVHKVVLVRQVLKELKELVHIKGLKELLVEGGQQDHKVLKVLMEVQEDKEPKER